MRIRASVVRSRRRGQQERSLTISHHRKDANVFVQAAIPLGLLRFRQGRSAEVVGLRPETLEVFPGVAPAGALVAYGGYCEVGRFDERRQIIAGVGVRCSAPSSH